MKGVVNGMNRQVLTKAFTKFGAVRNLDVVIAKVIIEWIFLIFEMFIY